MVAHSKDGGRKWSDHRSISHRNVWEHGRVWVAPQLSRLSDGRLVIICDEGHRTSGADWPPLTRWQQRPGRGMSNFLFWSSNNGRTWSEPVQIDDVGGEPGYLVDLQNDRMDIGMDMRRFGLFDLQVDFQNDRMGSWCMKLHLHSQHHATGKPKFGCQLQKQYWRSRRQ